MLKGGFIQKIFPTWGKCNVRHPLRCFEVVKIYAKLFCLCMNVFEEHFKASLCALQALSVVLFCPELRDFVQRSFFKRQVRV